MLAPTSPVSKICELTSLRLLGLPSEFVLSKRKFPTHDRNNRQLVSLVRDTLGQLVERPNALGPTFWRNVLSMLAKCGGPRVQFSVSDHFLDLSLRFQALISELRQTLAVPPTSNVTCIGNR